MNSRFEFGLTHRVYTISAVLLIAMAMLGGTVWSLMSGVIGEAADVEKVRVPQLSLISELELNVTRSSLQLRHAILSRTPQEMNAALADIGEKKKLIDGTLHEMGRLVHSAEDGKTMEQVTGLMASFWAIGGENIRLIQAGRKEEAFAFLSEKTVPARNHLLAPLAEKKKRLSEQVRNDLGSAVEHARSTRSVVLAAVLLVGAGLAGFAVYIARTVRQLGAEPGDLKRVANAVAAGDLSTPIRLRSGDTYSIMASMKVMAEKLALTVNEVRHNAESVATASAQIASGNADLSGRTEQQASSLQQTAASMEELGATVRQNAEHASQANALALNSSTVARSGGEIVGDVISTMQAINDSSRKIADIIGVIDSIAFQTNILALNAAVEAARAGEQGRGFAVVASEVRSLAQRSAEAAREIKGLIGASVERVAQGTQLVDRAGTTMQEIVSSIERVTGIVGAISSASAEQSSGVAQISAAVSQMDQATQQNATLVEESAAAAESLKQQSQRLVQAVAVFRIA